MSEFLSNVRVLALGAGVAIAGLTPAAASPLFVPTPAQARSDVLLVQDSATVVRRKEAHHDGGWKKRRHHREIREARRDRWRDHMHDHDGRGRQFRPKATPKYAYDAYGNLRVYDGKRWDDRDWDHRDGWDRGDDWNPEGGWYKGEHGPRIYRLRRYQTGDVPPSELDDILTAVPQ